MYSAHQIARFIISWCNHHHLPVTNLKLQKLLYFVQGEYARMCDDRLIQDDFYAWQLGPVIPDVYFKYSIFSSSAIPTIKHENEEVFPQQVVISIENILRKYARYSTWTLVDMSHAQDPWKYNYQIFGDKSVISYESIYKYFREAIEQ